MELSDDDIRAVAHLARLELSDAEVAEQRHHINALLNHIAVLQKLDMTDVPPTFHTLDIHNVLREDKVEPPLPLDEVLQNAPSADGNYFVVPRILEP